MSCGKHPALTIVINHADAEDYARLIGAQFPQVRAIVAPDLDRLYQHISEADALIGFRFPTEVLNHAKKLRWFQFLGAGFDSASLFREDVSNITVTNIPGIHGDNIADYVMAGAVMLHWDFRRVLREQAERKWNPRYNTPLAEMTLGVVGLGLVGKTIARRAKSAGMTVLGARRDVCARVEGVDQVFGSDQLKDLLALCDFVVLAFQRRRRRSGSLALLKSQT
ncbi:NAD(P)-dependent oxidoreductase [Bradyrhizobium sp. 138]|uniref:NAD(P)-dependent oxidoreductase n=1 Tax=Bradyrhizobium sp. 138 TaxID=2782615 RepID=UPI001FF8C905|nr:NAD(P)-dependent oxidoreductase [Bradyrhizobium sp. 138]